MSPSLMSSSCPSHLPKECQLQLQSSSRDSYLSQMSQLEQKCSTAFRQTSQVTEQMERLESNGELRGFFNR